MATLHGAPSKTNNNANHFTNDFKAFRMNIEQMLVYNLK